MRIQFKQLKEEFKRILLGLSFDEPKADLCATIFSQNSLDGVYTHGLNRFPAFIASIGEELVVPSAEPELIDRYNSIERWEGNRAPGMYNASLCMDRAMKIAKLYGIGCVSLRNTNHWMRGGTYGWQAANAGYIGICFTNTIANVTPWGGTEPGIGNNPLVIGVPRENGHVVLDMAMSQYSFGKLQEFKFRDEKLPLPGGYDANGEISFDPETILETRRGLPIGYWKGSGLSLLIDVIVTALSGGKSTAAITKTGKEVDVSQCFICIKQPDLHEALINEIIRFTKMSSIPGKGKVLYPGENTLLKRKENKKMGIPVNDKIWREVLNM